eukprot:m.69025 g.69025  ORF g.69025 m.69025 type:complete len:546 (+) comp8262_c0_seq2:97-1734(+)
MGSRRQPATPAPKMKAEVRSGKESDEWSGLDMADGAILALPQALFRMTFLTHLYLNNNNISEISPNISSLKNLKVLNLSRNKLIAIPPSLGEIQTLIELDLSGNQLASLPFELGQLHRIVVFGLENNPFHEPLATHVKSGGDAVLEYLIDNAPLTGEKPEERQWMVPVGGNTSITNRLMKEKKTGFSCFCYNILCDRYASRQMFRYCPSWALQWDYRKGRILSELEDSQCGVLCLQEVSMQEYMHFFHPKLQHSGYIGQFAAKNKCTILHDATFDGCATFFKSSYESVLEPYWINFGTQSMKYSQNCPPIISRCLSKDNVALFTLLKERNSDAKLLVINVHLTWDPIFKDVKVIQIMMCMKAVKEYYEKHNLKGTPIVVMGDFNSTPDSGVFEYMSKGQISPKHRDFVVQRRGADPDDNTEPIPDDAEYYDYSSFFEAVGTTHSFAFKSAYTSEMKCTNRTAGFTGIIDYIWFVVHVGVFVLIGVCLVVMFTYPMHVFVCRYTKELHNKEIWGPLPEDYLNKLPGCPNVHMPSDHLALGSKFLVK